MNKNSFIHVQLEIAQLQVLPTSAPAEVIAWRYL
jgi:hypothetical protein